MVLLNRPTLTIGTERFACLNSTLACSWGPSPSTRQVRGSNPGPSRRVLFSSTLPSFLLREIVFFRTFPTNPAKVLGLLYTTGLVYNNPNTIKSYKNYLQNTQHIVLRNRPTLTIGTERLACLNSPGSGGRALFSSTRPSFLLREIVFFAPSPPPTPQKC